MASPLPCLQLEVYILFIFIYFFFIFFYYYLWVGRASYAVFLSENVVFDVEFLGGFFARGIFAQVGFLRERY